MDLSLGGGKLHPESDAVCFFKLLLLIDCLKGERIERRQLADIVDEPRLGEWKGDVVLGAFVQRVDRNRRGWPLFGRRDTNAFDFQLLSENLQEVPRAENLERLGPIGPDAEHEP